MDHTKSVTLIVFLSLVMDLIAFTMILPLLPSLLDYYKQNNDPLYARIGDFIMWFRNGLNIPDTPRWNSVLLGGVIGSLFSFLQYLSSPLTGAFSDVYGRKRVLLLTLGLSLVSYLVFALSFNFSLFVFARVMGGLSKGNTGLCIAILTDVTDSRGRGKAMALVGIAYSLGFIIGPVLGAAFARLIRLHPQMFFQAPALAGIIITLLEIFLLLACLKETLPHHKRQPTMSRSFRSVISYVDPISLFSFRTVKSIETKTSLKRLGFVYFMFLFLFSGVEFTLTFLVHERFNYDSMQQGKMFFFMGVVMALIQGGFVRRLRLGTERRLAMVGVIALQISFVVTGLAAVNFVFYLGLVMFSFGSATVVPCLTTLATHYGGDEEKGTVTGVFRSLGALARAGGPLVTCSVYWYAGPVACYMAAMMGLFLPLLLLVKHGSHSSVTDSLNASVKDDKAH